MKSNKIFSIVLWVFAALWAVSILVFVDHENAGFYYFGGFVFGLIAIVLGALVNLFLGSKGGRNTTEIEMLPAYVTAIYVAVSVVINGIFVYLRDGAYNIVILSVNVIAMVLYLVYIHGLSSYAERVAATGDAVGQKLTRYGEISVEIAKVLGMSSDPAVKKKVLELKQKVDYSNNLVQDAAIYEEQDFYNALLRLERMIAEGSSEEEISALIDEADGIWKIRNSKLSAMS